MRVPHLTGHSLCHGRWVTLVSGVCERARDYTRPIVGHPEAKRDRESCLSWRSWFERATAKLSGGASAGACLDVDILFKATAAPV